MNKSPILMLILLAAFIFGYPALVRAAAPLQVALFDPVQLVEDSENIHGVRLNLVRGVNFDVSGLDLGLINVAEGMQKGVQLGLYNETFETSGVQFGLVNRTEWLNGLQIGLVNIHQEGRRPFFPILNFSF